MEPDIIHDGINILHELNSQFEDQDVVSARVCTDANANANANANENINIDILKENINKGQRLLQEELKRYNVFKDIIEDVEENKQIFHDGINRIKKALLSLSQLEKFQRINNYSTTLSSLSLQIDVFDNAINTHTDQSLDEIREDFKECVTKLRTIKDVYRVLQNSNEKMICSICMSRRIDSFFIPCGHTFCKSCLSDSPSKCFFCRQPISKISPLYFN